MEAAWSGPAVKSRQRRFCSMFYGLGAYEMQAYSTDLTLLEAASLKDIIMLSLAFSCLGNLMC